jgi:2-polyprenyl-3-methyl-5-hydroxy-6-metoxy-1,4-benzoquinol methylase
MPVKKVAVLCIKGEMFGGLEDQTARRVMRHLLLRGKGNHVDVFELDKSLNAGNLKAYGEYDAYVVIRGMVFITLESINNLSEIIFSNRALSAVVPVCNESEIPEQLHTPPFLYQTLTVFNWAVQEIFKKIRHEVREVSEVDNFCVAFRKDLLDTLSRDEDVCDLPRARGNTRLSFGVAKGIYTHRYGNVFESGRADLMMYVPMDAREVLDIGSAKGLFGELLKKRQKCTVTGVDIDEEMIKIASSRLDSVVSGDIEELLDKGALGKYDCILCGDVLEHLNNPWKVVGALKKHLRKGGLFIASTPNVMNWAVLFEQVRGRWDYVPASILSGTHIRFFTKQCLKELFIDAGYGIKEVSLQSFELPTQGHEFIERLRSLGNELSEEELKASEIVIVASSC